MAKKREDDAPTLTDIAILSKNTAQRVAPQGIASVLRHMIGCSYIGHVEEVRQEDWTVYYAGPGPNAHSLFIEGEAPEGPVFKEVAIGYGSKPRRFTYDPPVDGYLSVEFLGAAFDRIHGDFTETLHKILYIKPMVKTRPHVALEDHLEADGTEGPSKHRRQDPNIGRTGVAVEDL